MARSIRYRKILHVFSSFSEKTLVSDGWVKPSKDSVLYEAYYTKVVKQIFGLKSSKNASAMVVLGIIVGHKIFDVLSIVTDQSGWFSPV